MTVHAVLRNDAKKMGQQTYAVLTGARSDAGPPEDLSVLLYAGGWVIHQSGPGGEEFAVPIGAVSEVGPSALVIDRPGIGTEANSVGNRLLTGRKANSVWKRLSAGTKASSIWSRLSIGTQASSVTNRLSTDTEAGLVTIDEPSETEEATQVRGINRRHPGVEHRRTLTVSRTRPVVVIEDVVKSAELHRMSLVWRLAPGLTAVIVGREVHLLKGDTKVAKICMQADTTVEPSVDGTTLRVAVGSALCWRCTTTFIFPQRSARGISLPFETMPGQWPIQHRLEAHAQSEVLCVVLPAMAAEFDYRINYLKLLRRAPLNRLFILDDFGPQGSYLIASEGNAQLGDAVCALIESERASLGIDKRNVVFTGSSKGGTTALYLAHRLGYGHVLAGAPQTRIGHFLLRQAVASGRRLADYMCPGKSEAQALDWLDRLIFDLPLSKDVDCRIHVGEGDHHYQRHVLPYVKHVRKLGGKVSLDIGDYAEHSALGEHFPSYLEKALGDLFGITFSDPSPTESSPVHSSSQASPVEVAAARSEPEGISQDASGHGSFAPMISSAPAPAPALTVMAWREGDELVGRIDLPKNWSVASVEFAFYLQIANEKKAVRWYEDTPTTRFAWPTGADPDIVSIKGFAREVANPNYKLSATAPLLQRSAVSAE
ncbi:heparinase II/III family protein [Bordetella sp. LUAb4]|uniref:heparinase II/III family protein n=1 Tax=Bordetella sp. LUAb4 TaxID=2843195 RepID=UPI001E344C91|nr:heparinase II/III family protein [Bordetella sp. LUAb4]